jgi:tetratricopeptide (TPR) repeat protein
MTVPTLKPTGKAAVQVELLARLGLPASASPEDVDRLHQAASDFLTAAPPEIRGWARAQVAALDAAYIALTDPVGLEGSALMSPASPPTVVPGGPATPPARRGPAPAVAPDEPVAEAMDDEDPEIEGEPDVEDLAALYAMVTPSAHDDMRPQAKPARPAAPAPRPTRASARAGATTAPPTPASTNVWKGLFLGVVGIGLVAGLLVGINALVNALPGGTVQASQVAQASSGAPAVDEAKVADLMAAYQADPADQATLLALADEFYAGALYDQAATWLDKLLAISPDHIQGLLARGAVYFNLNDIPNAKVAWEKVATLEPENVEVHYDLGFLYLNQAVPDWAGVQAEWNKVIELDPGSSLAQTVRSHLDSLDASSMLPASSGDPGASAAPAASPAASPVASPEGSPAASPAASPAGSPAETTTP